MAVDAGTADGTFGPGGSYPKGPKAKPGGPGLGAVAAEGLTAGAVAGVLSGLPSTLLAVATGDDPLAAARAAGNLLLRAEAPAGALLAAGVVAHAAISVGWATVLAVAVRRVPARTSPVAAGAMAGAVIAALDLGLLAHGPAGRRWPLIRALPVGPQIADHLAFGVVAAAVLSRRDRAFSA